MKLRTLNVDLHRRDEAEKVVLVGRVDHLDLDIKVVGNAMQATYQYPARSRFGAVAISYDYKAELVQVMYRDRRWERLRLQAKRKGHPGWRQIEART